MSQEAHSFSSDACHNLFAHSAIAGLHLNMPGKHARSTDTMHTRPPRARMCKGIAETWLSNMSEVPVGYDASAARTGSRKQWHC